MSKRICAVTTVEITQRHFVIPAMRKLKENGWDVTIVCNMSNSFIEEYESEFHLVNIPFHRGISIRDLFRMPLRLRRLFANEQFDIVQYATPNASLYASIACRLAGIKHRVYCQWGIRYVGSGGIMRSILKLLEKQTCINSTAIRPASWKNLEFAVSEGLYDKNKATVIGNGGTVGVDLSQFDISKKESFRHLVESEYPQLKRKTVFSFIGRINADKGFFELLEAFGKLRKEKHDVALLFIGGLEKGVGTSEYEDEEGVVMTGWTSEVAKYISASDILVHPSYREGFSMVIQQAMAMAIPVITTDIPGPSEVIENNVSGILVPPRDADSLYKAMSWMEANEEQRKRMGASGLNRCVKLFSRDKMLELTLIDRENIIKSK